MEISESVQIIKALADNSRLRLVQALQEPQCVEELAHRCSLAPSTVCFHLGKLEKSGLVKKRKEQYYTLYSLNEDIFYKSLKDLISFTDTEEDVQEERLHRYRVKVLKAFMKNSRLIKIPAQYKKRLIILDEILTRFTSGTAYKESDVNDIIREICGDYTTIRRLFIDEGMMAREGDVYHVVKASKVKALIPLPKKNENNTITPMKTKHEIKREYKERKKPAGVFQIKNLANGKIYLGSSMNLEGPLNGHKFMLKTGNHRNEELQKDWNTFGPDKFIFEILEEVKVKDVPNFNLDDELTLLEQIWIEKLQPFSGHGYNKEPRIRQA